MSKVMTPRFSVVRSRSSSMLARWRSISGPSSAWMKGWSSTACRPISVSSGITRGTKPSPELSITIVSFIAGAAISTAALALSYFAPSTMFAQWTSSASGAGIESEPLPRHVGDQAGAGDVRRIVKLSAIGRLAHREHLGRVGLRLPRQKIAPVIGGEKRALVMVEPPSNFGRGGVLEVHNCVLALDERRLVEERPRRLVHQPVVRKLLRRPDALAMEAREQRRRARAIEAVIVVEDATAQAEILRTKPILRSRGPR